MKFSHFAFEALQQVRILVHIRSIFSLAERCIVILLVLPKYKPKPTKKITNQTSTRYTGEWWQDFGEPIEMCTWITNWEVTRSQALSLFRLHVAFYGEAQSNFSSATHFRSQHCFFLCD